MNDEAKRFKELNRFSENAKNEFNTLISALFQNAFTTHFEKALKENRPPEKKEIETFSIEAVETAEDKALFDFTQRVLLLSLLLGNEHADRRVQLADDDFGIGASFGVPSKDALEYLKSQIPLTKDEYAELERKVQFRAFTVSKLAEADFVNKAKMSLIDGIEHSKSFSEIWDEFKKIGSDAGVDISAGYFETVYRTNIQSAYNAGRLMRYKNNQPPAWELLFMEDGNMSEICTALMNEVGGKAIKSDDPFWSTVGFPPYHYNCRTTFRAVYDYELNEGEIALAAPKESAPLDNGFGGNPLEKESWWKITPAMIERADQYGITANIVAQARELDMQSYFPELLQGYETNYKGKNGGYVQMAKNSDHNPEEIIAAKRLADEGHKVYLLPKSNKTSSPDMIIDNEIGEMKEITSVKYGTIRGHIQKSGQQQRGRIIYIKINSEKQKERLFKIIKEEIKNIPMKTLLLDYNGHIVEYARNIFLK